jgi:hypothetical protein
VADDETERRIEAARAAGERARETAEFLAGLTKDDEVLRPIYNPEAFVFRDKAKGAAARGELPRTACRHPLDAIQMYVDDDSSRGGRPGLSGRMVNLFECGACHTPLWLVDPWGETVGDLVSA